MRLLEPIQSMSMSTGGKKMTRSYQFSIALKIVGVQVVHTTKIS